MPSPALYGMCDLDENIIGALIVGMVSHEASDIDDYNIRQRARTARDEAL
jgi:hypothetical protein